MPAEVSAAVTAAYELATSEQVSRGRRRAQTHVTRGDAGCNVRYRIAQRRSGGEEREHHLGRSGGTAGRTVL